MTREKRKPYESYQPIPHQSRFWIHSEACYTEEELNQRTWILKTRSNSGIHPDYLANPSSWFADDAQALINVYEHSWFYSNAFKTRHVLTRDDFHVQPIDNQRLQWPSLHDLMQKTGDYLLVRNKELSQNHLNQPMNYFLLDLNNILKGISQNSNIIQTQEQLKHLSRYVRSIEKNISPFVGTDRLFLANFRSYIEDEVHPYLTHRIESQLLRDRLDELAKTIKQLATDRNRILHFALNIKPVNPHPYTFAIDKPDNLMAYPTQAVKECGKLGAELIDPNTAIQLTGEQLEDCPNFQLINMQTEILDHYAKAITDLNELEQFHKVISQTIDLLGQAGEVYTVYQFKEQLSLLLKQIDNFVDSSSYHIDEIIFANTLAYHQAIQQEKKVYFFQKWIGSEIEKLNTFIRNQDTLAQFPSTTADLAKTNQDLKNHISQVIVHLNKPQIKETDFASLAEQAQELNALMNSMHRWVKVQHEIQGLEPPNAPEKLELLYPPKSSPRVHRPLKSDRPLTSQSNRKCPSAHIPQNVFFEMSTCKPQTREPSAIVSSDMRSPYRAPPSDNSLYLGLIIFLPIGLLALYLLYRSLNNSAVNSTTQGSKEEFEELKEQLDDLIIANQKVQNRDEPEITPAIELFIETYNQLNQKAQADIYDIKELKELYEDMKYFYNEYSEKTSMTY